MFDKIIIFIVLLFNFTVLANKPEDKLQFWEEQKKGTNIFSKNVDIEDIKAAKKYNIAFLRITFDKFKTKRKDFLIGDANNYQELDSDDLIKLKEVLNICEKEGMPVIITLLSLPGSRWLQNNKHKDDLKIWNDKNFQAQAAKMWRDLANELKGYSNVVGYNILNEPHPERLYSKNDFDITQASKEEISKKLFDFYNLVIASIREIDKDTPIIVDSSLYGDPRTFDYLKPLADSKVIYSFHMYEPFAYTCQKHNKGKYKYPGRIKDKYWDKKALEDYMSAVVNFQKTYDIPSDRILVGEFGGNRKSKGLDVYFKDLMEIFNKNSWHFAFYAFREDCWDGMDYQLGDKNLPESYWKAVEQGQKPILNRKDSYPQFKVLADEYVSVNEKLDIKNEFHSPNRSPRTKDIKYIVLHYTELSFDEALRRLCDPIAKVSSHYLIKGDGTILQLVKDQDVAYHAGLSNWGEDFALNETSIGIEIDNLNNTKFSPAQIDSCIRLCREIMRKYNIPKNNILGHSDIAPDRKLDPGLFFPWKRLAQENIGIWHTLKANKSGDEVIYKYLETSDNILRLQNNLKKFGYKIELTGTFDSQTNSVVRAFQSRFYPEIIFKQGLEFYQNLESEYYWDKTSNDILENLL